MPAKTKAIFADNDDLVATLYRMSGVIDAIYLAHDTTASKQIAEGALSGIHSTLSREIADLIDAAEAKNLVVNSAAD